MPNYDYDAFILLSFGGPEGMDDVMPFLRNVTRGRNVPDERLQEVAHHYEMFGGMSPINQQNRDLLEAIKNEFRARKLDLPVYWGNRNWHPLLEETVEVMKSQGKKNVLAFATAAYSSFSSCRQYLEDISRATAKAEPGAPAIQKIAPFFHHAKFIEANCLRLEDALSMMPENERRNIHVAFTAHSIPLSMSTGCNYQAELNFVACQVAAKLSIQNWKVVYQSRSGPPSQPWLEPDICDHIKELHANGVPSLAIAPVGFVSDHMEVIYDLDVEAKQLCDELKMNMVRAATAGTHPLFVSMIADLVQEACTGAPSDDPVSGACEASCCPSGRPKTGDAIQASTK